MENSNSKQRPIVVSSFSKELLLIVFGALIGALTNQIFFKDNKDYEVKSELQKDLLKEQFQYLNRILLFTRRYEITTQIITTSPYQIIRTLEKGSNKVLKIDTVKIPQKDISALTLPSFIINKEKRIKLLEDLEFIKINKDKINHDIYLKFDEILDLLKENPIPDSFDEALLRKSSWMNKSVQDKWKELTQELYYLTYAKLY